MQTDLFDRARASVSRSLIESLAPGGEWENDENYKAICPFRVSDSKKAFHIFWHDGQWCFKDFAGSGEGGDFIRLVELVQSCKPKEAAEWILGQTGHAIPEGKSRKGRPTKAPAVMPIPEAAKKSLNDTITSRYAAEHHGEPVTGWRYYLADGGWAFAVVRYRKPDGSKNITPYYWAADEKWHEGKPQKDKLPLYRLPQLLADPERPVLVVEGEKCADAAAKALPGWAVTTWSSGASSVSKTDWTPLAGRSVTVWPDNDEPGEKAASKIVSLVPGSVVLDVAKSSAVESTGSPDGWDIADAIAEGLDVEAFLASCPRLAPPEPELEEGEPAPYRCLGYDAAYYHFLKIGQRIPSHIPMGNFTASRLGEIAPPSYWARRGCISDKGGVDVQAAQAIVIDEQTRKGFYTPEILRGSGVWIDETEILINTGEELVYQDGRVMAHGEYRGEFAYTRSDMRFSNLDGEEATDAEGLTLAQLFHAQGFMTLRASVAVLGWTLISPFAGVLGWRPHIWVTGRTSSGKSFLLEEIVARLCGDYVCRGSGRSTEAGVRRSINMVPCPVILDEMTPKNKNNRENIVKLIELARNSCGDSSGRSTFASGTEGTVSYVTRSPFCLASVNVPDEGEEIANRFVRCELRAPIGEEAKEAKIRESRRLYAECMGDPARYRRRIFRALPRIVSDIAKLRVFLPRYLGGQRMADVWAPLLAAAWAVQSMDSVMDEGREWMGKVLEEAMKAGPDFVCDEDRVIEHILDAVVESDDKKKKTIAEWLEISQRSGGTDDAGFIYAEDLCARHGLRVVVVSGNKKVLAIATESDAIKKILRDTIYETGYDAQIRRHPLCINPENTTVQRFGAHKKRARLLDWVEFRKAYMEGEV